LTTGRPCKTCGNALPVGSKAKRCPKCALERRREMARAYAKMYAALHPHKPAAVEVEVPVRKGPNYNASDIMYAQALTGGRTSRAERIINQILRGEARYVPVTRSPRNSSPSKP